MASIIRAYVLGKWTKVGGGNEMAIAIAFPAPPIDEYGGWSEMTGQRDIEIDFLPVFIAQGEITSGQLTAIQADSRFLVIAQQTLDSVTGATSGGNWNSTLNQTQVNAFKSWLSTNWPGIPAALLTRCDNLVGMTRQNAARAVIGFIKSRQDAGV